MAITLADAITQVRGILNEASPQFWLDAEITYWLQEGTKIVTSKTLMLEAEDDISPLIANQLAYTSSDETWLGDLIEPYAAVYNDGANKYKGLIKVHPRQLGNVATFTSGVPKYYSLHNRNIYIWPLASAAVVAAGAKVTILYAKESDDITDLTDEYQHLPIYYAAAKAKQKDQKFAESTSLMTQFYNDLNFEREDKHVREVDSIDSFRIPKRGGRPGA